MGYVAAIWVPAEFFIFVGDARLANLIITVVSQFLAFGLYASVAGWIIGRYLNKWLVGSMICYTSYLISSVFVIAFVFEQPNILVSEHDQGVYQGLGFVIVAVCLLFFAKATSMHTLKAKIVQ